MTQSANYVLDTTLILLLPRQANATCTTSGCEPVAGVEIRGGNKKGRKKRAEPLGWEGRIHSTGISGTLFRFSVKKTFPFLLRLQELPRCLLNTCNQLFLLPAMVASFIWLALFFCLHVTLAIPVNHESLTVGDGAGQPLCRKSISYVLLETNGVDLRTDEALVLFPSNFLPQAFRLFGQSQERTRPTSLRRSCNLSQQCWI